MRRWLKVLLVILAVIAAAALAVWLWWRVPEPIRLPGYALDVRLPAVGARASPSPAAPLRVGFGTVDITPDISGTEPIWLAGFAHGRRAIKVHDPLLARALVLDDGRLRAAIVGLDLIGVHHDDTIRIRQALPRGLGIDYLAVCSLHNHNSPDTMGIWGPNPFRTGVDPQYLARVRDAVVDAVRQAAAALAPARLVAAEVDTAEDELIRDLRPPRVIDARLLALRFEDPAAPPGRGPGAARGTVVLWSNHPEALGSENREITSDFPHYVRRAVERDGGGPCLYLSGSLGGLMSPLEQSVRGLDGRVHEGDTFEKAEAMGEVLARRAVEALEGPGAVRAEVAPLGARARLIELELDNPRFWLAMKMGVLDRGLTEGGRVRTEVGALRIGPVLLALCPGEIYPEIVVGGVESPAGADFPGEPLERPPLREVAASLDPRPAFFGLVGLANDELGYFVPRTQWDWSSPYTYGQADAPYGEINSVGPGTAPAIHRALGQAVAECPR